MENLIKKTMTAFLVLLTLMIPVSAAVSLDNSDNRVINIETDDSYVDVVFYYQNSDMAANETVELTFSSDALRYDSTHELIALAGNVRTMSTVRLLLADNLNPGNYSMTVEDNSTSGLFTGNSGAYTLVVSTVTPDYYEPGLVQDNDYEDEVSPGDTLVLELELDMSEVNTGSDESNHVTYEDVSIEAYLVDAQGNRVSDIQETSDFNLGTDEEETVTLQFEVEEDLEEGTYYIFLDAVADEGRLFQFTHQSTDSLKFDVERADHSLVVTDLRASNGATAGDSLDVAVTILNNGQGDENNVLVSLSVAGETTTSNYFTVEEDEELVRYFTLTLPSGASGNELVTVAVANEDVSVSSSTTVNVEARNQAASLTEEQVAALLEARLNQGNNNGFDDLSLGWLVAGLLVVYLLVSNRGLMPTTSRAASTSSRGRKSSKKYY
jgi:methionine-rich copper-binding protein CopC